MVDIEPDEDIGFTINDTAILTPNEYIRLYSAFKRDHRLLFNGLLFTGMRTTEFTDFINVARGTWYNRNRRIVDIPASAVRKARVSVRRRSVPLSNAGVEAMEDILDRITNARKYNQLLMPTRQSWNDTMLYTATKAGMKDPKLFVPKLTRKTWESWLITMYPLATATIMVAMGHTVETSVKHYIGLGFNREEKDQIKKYTEGWLSE